MDEDILQESNPMITDTRIKVVTPLRKVFLGTEQGIFRLTGDVSTETRWGWRKDRYNRRDTRPVACIGSDPGTGALLAGYREGEPCLLISEDGGRHWDAATDWNPTCCVRNIATFGGGHVVIATNKGSLQFGELPEGDWQERSLPSAEAVAYSLSWNLADPNFWIAALGAHGVAISSDRGLSWKPGGEVAPPHRVVHTRGGIALVASQQGAFRSTDGGASWEDTELPTQPILGLCVDVAGTLFVILEVDGKPQRWLSTDTGVNWEVLEDLPLPDLDGPVHLEADNFHPGVIYFSSGPEVFLISEQDCRKISEGLPPIHYLLVL